MVGKQLETIGVLSVESDLVRFTVLSAMDGRELANVGKTLKLLTINAEKPPNTLYEYEIDETIEDAAEVDMPATIRQRPTIEWGHREQDPDDIWDAVQEVVSGCTEQLRRNGLTIAYIKAVAITNEMGTVVAWNAETGETLHNAIHWTDSRMRGRNKCTASVVEWLLQKSEAVKRAAKNCRFGTLDAWLLWKLTDGQEFSTDVTNASYTGLLDLAKLDWDRDACSARGLTADAWPAVRPSDQHTIITVGHLAGLSVNAVMARPSATLYGQGCYRRGQVSVTLGLLTAVALGAYDKGVPPAYARCGGGVGPVAVVGYIEPKPSNRGQPKVVYGQMTVSNAPSVLCWLSGNQTQNTSTEECVYAYSSGRPSSHHVYVVPALDGLPEAPYNRPDARLVVCGINELNTRDHMIAAAVDALAFTVNDMVRLIGDGAAVRRVDTVFMDGRYVHDVELIQQVANIADVIVLRNRDDMAVHGVARMAAATINVVYRDQQGTIETTSTIPVEHRSDRISQWLAALRLSYGWAAIDGQKIADEFESTGRRRQTLSMTPFRYACGVCYYIGSTYARWYRTAVNEMRHMVRTWF